MQTWKPKEVFIHARVRDDQTTKSILRRCGNAPVTYVESGLPEEIVGKSKVLKSASGFLDKVKAGKQVLYVAPAGSAVDEFRITDDRMICPHFPRLKLSSNGCSFACEWCYLKLTYRNAHPFITVRVQYEKIKEELEKKLRMATQGVMFNAGEVGDSIALDHLTGAAAAMIPWLGATVNGYLYMLTKSDRVDHILNLPHNGHTVLAWSMNAPEVSRRYEVGAPPFERRLEAARKAQNAGYPVRVRLDPIVPIPGWKGIYARTVRDIFRIIAPDRVTLGTLRFEPAFYRMRKTMFSPGSDLGTYVDDMKPMFSPAYGTKRVGKYSYPKELRAEIFSYVLREIRKYSACPVALCKEEAEVWSSVGLDLSTCACACQFHASDMSP